jgi:hypothetical protein
MTPKGKAKKLVKKYYRDSDLLVEDLSYIQAKECALIAVDEMLKLLRDLGYDNEDARMIYQLEVKQEIENL